MQKTITHPGVGEVTLSRTRRSRRILLSVRADGRVRLSYPWWVTHARALHFLDEKREWIADNRRRMAEKYAATEQNSNAEGGVGNGTAIGPGRDAAARAGEIERLRAEAKLRLPAMVARLAALHGFSYGTVRVKATRSRWGSCNARGDINLSLSLVTLPDHLAEYIVLHELCHTVHRDHSARFHALLDRVTEGRHRSLSKELRAYRPCV